MKKYLLVLVIIFLFNIIYAQNEMRVVGKGEIQPSELIDKTIRDANGEVCAGLMISTDLDGFTYDSYNGVVQINRRPGEDLLFLSPDERVVTIYKTGYASLKIILSDFNVKLKSGEVWKLKITGDKINDLIPISIVIKPNNASIFIDDKPKGNSSSQKLSPGEHSLRIEKEGYKTIDEKIKVSDSNILFNYTLQEVDLIKVQINSIPAEARIYINNVEKGVTNKGLFMYPGNYTLKLLKLGYMDIEEKIDVTDGKENKFMYNLIKNAGMLVVNVIPADAELFINKEKYGVNKQIELSPGKYKIEVIKDGYFELSETIEIELGKTISKDFTLQPKVGKLQFEVTPVDAEVTLNRSGKTIKTWQGVEMLKDLQTGDYELIVKRSGYKTITKKIKIEENNTTIEDITLFEGKGSVVENLVQKQNISVPENMIYVEGGTFNMGSTEGYDDEKPVHSVTLDGFYIGKYEVTQKEWTEIMGNNPSNNVGDKFPVEKVSWNDVQEYLKKLNQKTGKNYRLPTEAEWEYAAKGGNKSKGYIFSGSNNSADVAWSSKSIGSPFESAHQIGTKMPNEIGIYDMSGNVFEWCSDWYDEEYYKNSPTINPKGPDKGSDKVMRGGYVILTDIKVRCSYRKSENPEYYNRYIGFRLALDLNENNQSMQNNQSIKTINTKCSEPISYMGKTYNTVQIGNQCWFKENLDAGTMISGSSNQTNNNLIEKYCYNDDKENCITYGGLYQWNEAVNYESSGNNVQGICPSGWHIPTLTEFTTLKESVNFGNSLKANGQGYGTGAGTDSSGFSALLAGYRSYDVLFYGLGSLAHYWSSTETNSLDAKYLGLGFGDNGIYFQNFGKNNGFSVRCLKDEL